MVGGKTWGVGGIVGALRTACDRKSQRNNPRLQEARSLSSQSLLQLCPPRRPHSWTDLHLIILINKAPDFVLKVERIFSDMKSSFASSPILGQTLLWAPPSEVPRSLLFLSKPSSGTGPKYKMQELGETKQP